jgi:hypothetical protein
MQHGHDRPRDAWTAFGLGVLGGTLAGPMLLSFAGLQPLGVLALVGAIAVRPRPFGAAGGLIGWPVSWLLLLVAASARCDPASCIGPDLTPWVIVSIAVLAVGLGILAYAIRRARSTTAPT